MSSICNYFFIMKTLGLFVAMPTQESTAFHSLDIGYTFKTTFILFFYVCRRKIYFIENTLYNLYMIYDTYFLSSKTYIYAVYFIIRIIIRCFYSVKGNNMAPHFACLARCLHALSFLNICPT